MIQGIIDNSLFVLAESPVLAAGSRGIGALVVGRNDCIDGAEANDAPNLISGRTSNIHSEDMAELRRQVIAIDDDNYPATDNVPRQGETTAGTVNLRREVIVCPQKADIICMTPLFVCHCFRFFYYILRGIS